MNLCMCGLLISFCARGTFGPCRALPNALMLGVRMVLLCGCIPWAPSLRAQLFHSPYLAVQAGLFACSAVMLPGVNARMRYNCAKQLGQQRAGEKEDKLKMH